jgi:menaquinol-cytochrome c reductase iron-sulfur subunit
MDDTSSADRRGFFTSAIYGLWAIITGAIGLPAAGYLLLPPKSKKKEAWIEAGDISQIDAKFPEEVVFRRNRVDGWKVTSEKATAWVVKVSDQQVVALAPQCTHLGCAYHWDDTNLNFLCPCHTSTFDKEGKVLAGPAPRPLDRYQAKVENGKIYLGEIVPREGA